MATGRISCKFRQAVIETRGHTIDTDTDTNAQGWTDRTWQSPDGLTLYFRDYAGGAVTDRPPIICMHGLTRNARDFAELAERLAGEWRVIVPDMRGRGESDYADDAATYNPLVYVQDVEALLEQEGIDRFVAIGTSMGGLMTMMLAMIDADRIAGAVLNDIGPEIDPAGLDRIKNYVGQSRSYPSWMHAARALMDVHQPSHPTFTIDDWLAMAKRNMSVQQNGRIGFDYDMSIAEPFNTADGAAPPDLWPALEALAGRPVLLIRGALSDLFSPSTMEDMHRRLPGSVMATIPEVGHAPLLTEADAVSAIDAFLRKLA
ncbi:MAG: alpha/beta hydrolase [Pontixanthobacter sp.]